MFTRMPDDDPKWSSTGKLCTNGAWPCEMSTTLASLEAENARLEARVKRLEEALRNLVKLGKEGMKPDYNEWLTFHDKVAQVAEQALED